MSLSIEGRRVGPDTPPLVVAEISGNHAGSLERALNLVDACAEAGVDAVKLQTYTADSMTLNIDSPDFTVTDERSPWRGQRLYDLYDRAHTPWKWHNEIFERARGRGLIAFSSAFDNASVDFLVALHVPCIKIASFENTDIPLIRKAANTGKPLIISTGMASREELRLSIDVARRAGCQEILLLKCTSAYPAPASDANLSTIEDMRQWTGLDVGLSDHSLGIGVAVASVSFGAVMIEKHITLDRFDDGVDSKFSMTPDEMSLLVHEVHQAWEARGKIQYGPSEADAPSMKYRRSLYFARACAAGSLVGEEDIRSVRPAFGLEPRQLDEVVGKRLAIDVQMGDRVNWEAFEG